MANNAPMQNGVATLEVCQRSTVHPTPRINGHWSDW